MPYAEFVLSQKVKLDKLVLMERGVSDVNLLRVNR